MVGTRVRGRWRRAAGAGLVAGALAATAACGGGAGAGGGPGRSAAPAEDGATDLSRACPPTVVIQMNWFPQAEHGGLYRMLGPDLDVDANRKRMAATLVDRGRSTGVRLEIRAGGPAVGFQQVSAQLAADDAITLGVVATDEAVQNSGGHPSLAVFAPLERNPQMIMWSPAEHPQWRTIADVGRSGATVLYHDGAAYMEYLVGAGILRRDQLDGSYDGSPARFVAEGGAVAQQGYATNEPYLYEKEIPAWHRPVAFQLVHDAGYPIYPEALAIRAADHERLAPCLRLLVPVAQQSTVDFLRDPGPTNDVIVRVNEQLDTGYGYSRQRADFAVDTMRRLGLAGNGPSPALGDFDQQRVRRVIDLVAPIVAGQGGRVSSALRPQDIATNEFVDPAITLPP